MKTKLTRQILMTATFGLLFSMAIISCKKEKNSDPDTTEMATMTAEAGTADALYDDVFSVIAETAADEDLDARTAARISSCATVTVSPADDSYPKTVTVDFGSGCTSTNGVTRKGSFTFSLSSKLLQTGATVSVSFTNYSVNGYQLEGTYSLVNNSSQATGISFTVAVDAGKITYPDGQYFEYETNQVRQQVAGTGTLTPLDDEYDVTGSMSLANSEGKTLTASVTSPLHRNLSCRNIVSGTMAISFNGINGVFDYGAGDCDTEATLVVLGKTYTITLK